MARVGIVTICSLSNYGNRLQNLALQWTIESLGHTAETIWIEKNGQPLLPISFAEKNTNQNVLKKLKNMIVDMRLRKRNQKFAEFNEKYIYKSCIKADLDGIYTENPCDFYVVGSDQVWNWQFDDVGKVFFLTNQAKEKRIGYAISIGQSSIPDELIEFYKTAVDGFPVLSFREQQGSCLIEKISGKNTPVVLDPTMLIEKEQWLELCDNLKKPNGRYMLVVLLKNNPENEQKVRFLSEKYALKVVHFGNIKQKKGFENSPADFVNYINHASLVFTDSFHTTVFSILLETPFVVVTRGESMDSRLTELVMRYGLEDGIYENAIKKDNTDMDFSVAKTLMRSDKEKSRCFLAKALEEENE
jgi:hypothetical protein